MEIAPKVSTQQYSWQTTGQRPTGDELDESRQKQLGNDQKLSI